MPCQISPPDEDDSYSDEDEDDGGEDDDDSDDSDEGDDGEDDDDDQRWRADALSHTQTGFAGTVITLSCIAVPTLYTVILLSICCYV